MQRPEIHDLLGWQNALLDHRRALFERVVVAFPEITKKHRSLVDIWRLRLGPVKAP
jgi:hypothetical protein